jgi:CheY-like chemotaxis protein
VGRSPCGSSLSSDLCQDTGCGIKEENLLTIFENEQNMSKLGLGLSKKFIESMGGNIRVESVFGAGTTVFIDLPQKRVGNRFIIDDKNKDNVNDVIQYLDCSQYKMLICDDDNLDIKVTKKILEKYKFQISYVTDPMECIKKIKSGEIYDVLLLDYKMPLMDGMSVLKAIKSLENYNFPKIIVFTANAVTGAREYYISNGFDEYLSKPIDIRELDRIINSFFKK